jgi:aspartate-semialdehyde dehydrogenase
VTDATADLARPTLALLGARGYVAEAVLRVLGLREDLWGEVRLLSLDPGGGMGSVRGESVEIEPLTRAALEGVHVAVLNLRPDEAAVWAPRAVEAGAVAIDNSSAHRGDQDVPLVVPEVNPAKIRSRPKGIVAMPGPITLTMVDTLHALNAAWELTDLVVTALLAASSADEPGIERLYAELAAVGGRRHIGQSAGDVRAAVDDALPEESPFPAPLAMNLVPHVGRVSQDGFTDVEVAVGAETRKVLGLPDLRVTATCIQVPVVSTHSIAVHATFAQEVTLDGVRRALVDTPGVVALDDPEDREFPTPVDTVGADPRFAGRVRQPPGQRHTLDFFICADTLRRGAMGLVLAAELVCREITGLPEPRPV